MGRTITVIPGDGIGPEVTEAARRVLEATGIDFTWDYQLAGTAALEEHGVCTGIHCRVCITFHNTNFCQAFYQLFSG